MVPPLYLALLQASRRLGFYGSKAGIPPACSGQGGEWVSLSQSHTALSLIILGFVLKFHSRESVPQARTGAACFAGLELGQGHKLLGEWGLYSTPMPIQIGGECWSRKYGICGQCGRWIQHRDLGSCPLICSPGATQPSLFRQDSSPLPPTLPLLDPRARDAKEILCAGSSRVYLGL